MTATIRPADWLGFMMSEYIDGFVRDGGAAVKFAIPLDDASGAATGDLRRQAAERDYVVAHVDAGETRVDWMHELFFAIARQVPWQEVADRAVLRLSRQLGYQAPPPGAEPLHQRISEANHLDADGFGPALQPLLTESIFRDRTLARDFRVAMFQLCLGNLRSSASDEQRRAAMIAWLCGEVRTVGAVRPYQILSPINRTNARYHLKSLLRFLRFVGFQGLIITISAARLAEARNPKDGLLFYGRSALLDFYESVRQFIDETDRLEGCLLVIVPTPEFLDEDPRQRGMAAYQALQFRIYDEIRDAQYVNPMASLVRLSAEASPVPATRQAGAAR